MKDQLGNVGVSWGRTVAATATAAKKISSTQNLNDNKKLRFIPIVGDFLIPQIEGYNLEASTIAAELTRALGADIETQAALNVPASLPEDFFEGNPTEIATHKEIIRSFLTTLPDYQSLFGNRDNRNDKPLIQSLDTIISGCGFIDSNGGNLSVEDRMDSKYFNLTRHIQEPEREALRQAASGDLCSRLIASQNASTKGKELVQAINQRVFAAPTLEDIQLCKERSRDEETLGVVIVASGAEKSPVLTQICLAGLVSELIIDQQLANRMAQTFGIDPLPLLQL
jgi:DNA-binding transcriptional regulator LsrR (DeoR family)